MTLQKSLILVLLFTVNLARADFHGEAVTNFFIEQHKALVVCSRIVIDHGNITEFKISDSDYYHHIYGINTDGLPDDLRAAWEKYVTAWKNKISPVDPLSTTTDLVMIAEATSPYVKVFHVVDLIFKAAQRNPHNAWNEVCKIAKERYGIDNYALAY